MKKALYLLVGLFGLLVLTALIVPFVVDVDKYRPEIVRIANESLHGNLEIGKLKLSLWGHVHVKVDGVKLSDKKGRQVLSVKDALFELPFFSIVSGSPTVTFRMNQPELAVFKNKKGEMNILTLVKNQGTRPPSQHPPTKSASPSAVASSESSASVSLPPLAMRAQLGVELMDAQLVYKDAATDLESRIKDLNVRIKNISLSKPMTLEMWADFDAKMGKSLTLQGAMKVDGTFAPKFEYSEFQGMNAELKIDADDLLIQSPDSFLKKSSSFRYKYY